MPAGADEAGGAACVPPADLLPPCPEPQGEAVPGEAFPPGAGRPALGLCEGTCPPALVPPGAGTLCAPLDGIEDEGGKREGVGEALCDGAGTVPREGAPEEGGAIGEPPRDIPPPVDEGGAIGC